MTDARKDARKDAACTKTKPKKVTTTGILSSLQADSLIIKKIYRLTYLVSLSKTMAFNISAMYSN